MPSVYVGTSLLNIDNAKRIINRFQKVGVNITYNWTAHGQVFNEIELCKYGIEEMNGVKNADLFFMLQPGRAGTHVELGLALAYSKPIVIVTNDKIELKTFYFVPNVFQFYSEDEAFTFAIEKLKS